MASWRVSAHTSPRAGEKSRDRNPSTNQRLTDQVFTSEDESAHTRDEARQKAVEGVGADEQTVEELQRSRQQDVQQIRIHHLQLVGRRAGVLLEKPTDDGDDRVRHGLCFIV